MSARACGTEPVPSSISPNGACGEATHVAVVHRCAQAGDIGGCICGTREDAVLAPTASRDSSRSSLRAFGGSNLRLAMTEELGGTAFVPAPRVSTARRRSGTRVYDDEERGSSRHRGHAPLSLLLIQCEAPTTSG